MLIENLDEIFAGLRRRGQHRLRALIQERGRVSVVATTTALFRDVQDYAAPFFGGFDIVPLDELTVDDAVHLLARLARSAGDDALATFVATPNGRARVRAVHHLAGGNHRVYIMLAQFLTRERLDALVEPFLRLLDELTPYYQAQMYALSPQQRKLVDVLSEARGALAVRDLAARASLGQQTTSSQLHVLRARRVVQLTKIGREAFYELREPLFRMTLEIRRQRGGAVRALVEFLRHWYSQRELVDRIRVLQQSDLTLPGRVDEALAVEGSSDETVVHRWAERADAEPRGRAASAAAPSTDPRVRIATADLHRCVASGTYGEAANIAEEIASLQDSPARWNDVGALRQLAGDTPGALAAFETALRAAPTDPDALFGRAAVLLELRRYDEALAMADQMSAESVLDRTAGRVGAVATLRARAIAGLGRFDEALEIADAAYRRGERNPNLGALHGLLLLPRNRFVEAGDIAHAYLAHTPDHSWLRLVQGQVAFAIASTEHPNAAGAAGPVIGAPDRARLLRSMTGDAYRGSGLAARRGARTPREHAVAQTVGADDAHRTHAAAVDGGTSRRTSVAARLHDYHEMLRAAVAAYRKARAGRPALPNEWEAMTWRNEAVALQALGETADAVTAYREALRADPQDIEVHRALVEALLDAGEFETALRTADQPPSGRSRDRATVDATAGHSPEHVTAPERSPLAWARARALAGLGRSQAFLRAVDDLLMPCADTRATSHVARIGATPALVPTSPGEPRPARTDCETLAGILVRGVVYDLILRRPGDGAGWHEVFGSLAAAYRRRGFEAALGGGVVAGSAVLLDARVSRATAEAWVATCETVLQDETLALSVRLLRSIAAYATDDHDERTLLRVPAEERGVIDTVLASLSTFGVYARHG